MPRKKREELPPLESFTFTFNNEDIICEVRDGSCKLVYRGSHKRDEYDEKIDSVMEKVAYDYLTPNGRKRVPSSRDYLATGTDFATQVEIWGFGGINGEDNSTLRKKLYHDVKKRLTIFENAIKAKQNEKNTD